MANWTNEKIQDALSEKIKAEVEKLKSRGQKMSPDYLAYMLANCVRALMCDARRREIQRVQEVVAAKEDLKAHLDDRRHGLTAMTKALWNHAGEHTEAETVGK